MSIRNDCELVIKASQASLPNVYFVGPYGARVSFASQQRRVLNLIWALREGGDKLWPNMRQPRAAVIGAGIAGVTCAAALRMQKCSVWLYESTGSELGLQRQAKHRFVHPSINFWPEQPLSWTTRFPFMDWYAASCEDIIKMISRQWQKPFRGKIAQLKTNYEFKGFEAVPPGGPNGGRVKLSFVGRDDEFADIVFITTGYGREKDLDDPKFKSYWESDHVDRLTEDKDKHYAVSGTGDGGVIDVLRLTYPSFMSDELALRFLLKIDPDAGDRSKKSLPREIVSEIEQKAEALLEPNARSRHYHEKYTEFALNQDDEAKQLLPPLPPQKNPIMLIGRYEHPYDISSAPIHKILLALSIALKRIEYHQGEVTRDAGGVYWRTKEGEAPVRIEADYVVVRHGAIPPIADILDPDALGALQGTQRELGDYFDLKGYDEKKYFDDPTIAPGRHSDPEEFYKVRTPMAQEFLRSRFDVGMRSPLSTSLAGFEVMDERAPDVAEDHPFGRLPNELFGIPLKISGDRVPPIDPLVGRSDHG
ncbi:MAG: NAD(P)/FAD-dependent oxidoreductase [Sphingomonas sp.]|uniref:NAD(P)-binding protein n=1 Tax=Sphingomonas sp. TaxID=28214 RepID=UPI00260052DB|nr:FAD/NAD(P)-binding protein [Sphingomonas sp.]MBX3563603.1 NAD(P)/FAD-dependent oxidoreductase [Sphingomonas sp.]